MNEQCELVKTPDGLTQTGRTLVLLVSRVQKYVDQLQSDPDLPDLLVLPLPNPLLHQ